MELDGVMKAKNSEKEWKRRGMNRYPENYGSVGNQAPILLENADYRKAFLNTGKLFKNPSEL